MTTTMQEIPGVISLLRQQSPQTKVIIKHTPLAIQPASLINCGPGRLNEKLFPNVVYPVPRTPRQWGSFERRCVMLQEKLARKEFVVTMEVDPPRGADPWPVFTAIHDLADHNNPALGLIWQPSEPGPWNPHQKFRWLLDGHQVWGRRLLGSAIEAPCGRNSYFPYATISPG